jgi:polysaccharide pyruvyl transferase WcaK-like protein
MIIEIRGTGFRNKGAELMLAAIVDRFRWTMPEVRLAVRPSVGPYSRRAHYGLLQVFDPRSAGRLGWFIERIVHRGYRSQYGLVAESEIDAVLDASGFALGDAWQPEWVEGTARTFERWHRDGKKIILLPQALGPFENAPIRNAARRAFACTHLVYARDAESANHVRDLLADTAVLREAPDFTGLVEGRLPADFEVRERLVALVPNAQMLRHGDSATRTQYVPLR